MKDEQAGKDAPRIRKTGRRREKEERGTSYNTVAFPSGGFVSARPRRGKRSKTWLLPHCKSPHLPAGEQDDLSGRGWPRLALGPAGSRPCRQASPILFRKKQAAGRLVWPRSRRAPAQPAGQCAVRGRRGGADADADADAGDAAVKSPTTDAAAPPPPRAERAECFLLSERGASWLPAG